MFQLSEHKYSIERKLHFTITYFGMNGRLFHKCYLVVRPIEIGKEKMSSKIFSGIFTRSIRVRVLVSVILFSFSLSVIAKYLSPTVNVEYSTIFRVKKSHYYTCNRFLVCHQLVSPFVSKSLLFRHV